LVQLFAVKQTRLPAEKSAKNNSPKKHTQAITLGTALANYVELKKQKSPSQPLGYWAFIGLEVRSPWWA